MARIRSIKPEFPQSESMGRVCRDARLTFIELWTIADDEGRLRGNSRMLASLLFPYDTDAIKLMDGWLDQLQAEGCIIRYKIASDSYIQICNWLDHQKIDHPSKSKIPPPLASSLDLANSREEYREDQGSRTKEGKGEDGKGPNPPSEGAGGAKGKKAKLEKPDPFAEYSEEVSQTVNQIIELCPNGDPDGKRKITVNGQKLAIRVEAILKERPKVTGPLLVQSWKDYLATEPTRVKAPQYFFGKPEDQDSADAANWVEFMKFIFHKIAKEAGKTPAPPMPLITAEGCNPPSELSA